MMPRNRFLPQDIMLCILTRLPVESLVRFKSVCKSWCELFATQEFITMHINQFSKDPKNEALIIQCYQGYLIGSEPMINILDFPACFTEIVGCLNGLVCMVSSASGVDDRFVLWNPALKLFNIVKFPNQEDLSSQYRWNFDLLRLGYDAEEADFKVVLPIRSKEENPFDKALVYSANSDSWKKIDMEFEFFIFLDTQCRTGHENPHWDVLLVDWERVLVYLDVRNLVFKSVPFNPNWIEKHRVLEFMDWKGSISALIWNFSSTSRNIKSVEIWVLCDGDEEKIWRKNHTFEPIDVGPGRSFPLCTKNGKLLVVNSGSFRLCTKNGKLLVVNPGSFRLCTKNGKLLVVNPGSFRLCTKNEKLILADPKLKLLVFDPETRCVVDEEIISDGNYQCLGVYRYTKSLVYFKGMNKVVEKKRPSI